MNCNICGTEHTYYYVHSKCCDSHWEMTYNAKTKKYALECVTCGKELGYKLKRCD